MIINETESFCSVCQVIHKAFLKKEGNSIYFEIECPKGGDKIKISGNAEIFLNMRMKSTVDINNLRNLNYSWSNLLEITDDCNFKCAVCYVNAGSKKNPNYLQKKQIVEIAENLRSRGIHQITLTGGEPTIHPDIMGIIKALSKIGLTISMPTNGYLLGTNNYFAKELRKNGLDKIHIQFDSLKDDVHQLLKNNNFINIKKTALDNTRKAGFGFSTITTVTRENLDEVGDIIKYVSGFAPKLNTIVFQAAAFAGRFNLNKDSLVDREEIIEKIIDSRIIKGLSINDFLPFPLYYPLWIQIHPDCAVILPVSWLDGIFEPLSKSVDLQKLYRLMANSGQKPNYLLGHFSFFIYLFRSIRKRSYYKCLKIIFGLVTKKGKNSIIFISIEQFLGEKYQDMQRIKCCTTKNVCEDGALVSACNFNHPDSIFGHRSQI
jgi:uncharacterized radical SAM superfamily Fe-S cluster-containing enzyme